MSLGVVTFKEADGRSDRDRASLVVAALELAADSFDPLGPASTWAPVATLPPELRAVLQPPPLRHTAGVLLDLIDRATDDIRIAAPFADRPAVAFLTQPLIGASHRGVEVTVVTSPGHATFFAELARQWNPAPGTRSRLRVSEVQTHLSPLGSH